MIFNRKKHNPILYNTLLNLSRNSFFYEIVNLDDTYETRIYLMFLHYSIILFIQKKRKNMTDQENYNNLFFYVENNMRELGYGDVAVNKKMKDLNKIFYDILLKLSDNQVNFKINRDLINKYFGKLAHNEQNSIQLEVYLKKFYNFCFELPSNNMIKEIQNYKF